MYVCVSVYIYILLCTLSDTNNDASCILSTIINANFTCVCVFVHFFILFHRCAWIAHTHTEIGGQRGEQRL